MAILDFVPAIEISRKIVREKTNQAVLRLLPDSKAGQIAPDRTFGILLGAIFTTGLLSLLVINTSLAQDAFVLQELKQQAQVLTDQREAIIREVAAKSSPDKLAESAGKLGMVATSNPRFLNMSAGSK